MTIKSTIKIIAKFGLVFMWSNLVFGSGYQIAINSARSIGQANAGNVAAQDTMVTMLNPATIMSLPGSNYSSGATILDLNYNFDLNGSPLEGSNVLGLTGEYELQLPTDPGNSGSLS